MMAFRKLALVGSAALLATACALPPVPVAWSDPRRGEEVSRICIGSKPTRWGKLDSNSVILIVGEDAYELELDGACKLKRSDSSINLASSPASDCLETSAAEATDSCVVRKMYMWRRDRGVESSIAHNSPRGMTY